MTEPLKMRIRWWPSFFDLYFLVAFAVDQTAFARVYYGHYVESSYWTALVGQTLSSG